MLHFEVTAGNRKVQQIYRDNFSHTLLGLEINWDFSALWYTLEAS